MANAEQLAILKQGVEVWNEWRDKNHVVEVDLSNAELSIAYLSKAYLREANLSEANLFRADLSGADLTEANLTGASLYLANLSHAYLRGANLGQAQFFMADLNRAYLFGATLKAATLFYANLRGADLSEADLRQADLSEADLNQAKLSETNFSSVSISSVSFGSVDLSEAIGLENVSHSGPSTIGTDTFARSKGKIPEVFLRGCGLSDWEIEEVKLYNPDLSNDDVNKVLYRMYELRATQALQISPLFISYSHGDSVFVDKIGSYLTQKGIRFWWDIHEMKSGRMEKQISRAIRLNPTVLLILSEHSLSSDWVEHEVRTARELEKEIGRDVLCPIALDDSWKSSSWPKRIMEQIMEYNILDFSNWRDDSKFDVMFRKLIDGLELFYKG